MRSHSTPVPSREEEAMHNVRLAAIFLALSSIAYTQSTYGVFKGAITDPSGAVVRDAAVELSLIHISEPTRRS